MSHVSFPCPDRVSTWLALDVPKLSIVAGVLLPAAADPGQHDPPFSGPTGAGRAGPRAARAVLEARPASLVAQPGRTPPRRPFPCRGLRHAAVARGLLQRQPTSSTRLTRRRRPAGVSFALLCCMADLRRPEHLCPGNGNSRGITRTGGAPRRDPALPTRRTLKPPFRMPATTNSSLPESNTMSGVAVAPNPPGQLLGSAGRSVLVWFDDQQPAQGPTRASKQPCHDRIETAIPYDKQVDFRHVREASPKKTRMQVGALKRFVAWADGNRKGRIEEAPDTEARYVFQIGAQVHRELDLVAHLDLIAQRVEHLGTAARR